MDHIEKRLMEEVQKYVHLYDSSSPDYKDCQMASNSWKEISKNIGLDITECTKRWKNLRDKYVRARKRLSKRSGDRGRKNKMPVFYLPLSWLAPHIKHRETESNYDDNKDGNDLTSGLSTSSVAEENQPAGIPSSRTESSSSSETSPLSPSPKTTQKRKRKGHDWFQKQVAQLDERTVELQHRLLQENDEFSRFGQTVADMLRRLPEEHRPQAMFDVHKLLFERQQQKR
ncbi:uncharacterized protein [Mobula birostris]|uniref:uncharacterized protein n=1 Tax=Mobula birostris TaxID=1983395 RepID=UPI003B288D57